jgi:hypothetical protein
MTLANRSPLCSQTTGVGLYDNERPRFAFCRRQPPGSRRGCASHRRLRAIDGMDTWTPRTPFFAACTALAPVSDQISSRKTSTKRCPRCPDR